MQWFKKKQSPFERRIEELNQHIAELEAQARGQQQEAERRAAETTARPPANGQDHKNSTTEAPAAKSPSGPRFRTTVTPKGATPIHGIEPHEVDFFTRKDKLVDIHLGAPPDSSSKTAATGDDPSLHGSSQNQIHTFLDNVLRRFAKPKPSQASPHLADLLSTGSFQALKPTRYSRRKARNRAIFLILILFVVVYLLVKFITR